MRPGGTQRRYDAGTADATGAAPYIERLSLLKLTQGGPQILIFQFIIFAALAAVVLFQLYSVLGRRVGRQPEDAQPEAVRAPSGPVPPPALIEGDANVTGMAALRARDPAFDIVKFLSGAKTAYETIVRAFTSGDRNALRPLLSPTVMQGFEDAITRREGEARSETVEFLQPPRADLEKLTVTGDDAQADVRFLAELRKRSKGPEGEAVDDVRTAEVWTFQRNLKSRDPNWTLIHVDAAEA
jgi:predicted lipid-binding transport protein (Tim44 family)